MPAQLQHLLLLRTSRSLRFATSMIFLGLLPAFAAQDAADPYRLTEPEKAACTGDALRLCAETYPDERKLLACLKANRSSLSAECLPVFDAGIKRRRL